MELSTDTEPNTRTTASCFYSHVDPIKVKGCVDYKYKFFPTKNSDNGTLHMTVGIPASGKSTYVQNLSSHLRERQIPHDVISLDAIRNKNKNLSESEIINVAKFQVDQCIMSKKHCVYDATNVTNDHRKAFLESTLQNGGEIFVSLLNVNPEIASYRDARRGSDSVGRKVIINLHRNLKSPLGIQALWKEREESIQHNYNYNIGIIDVELSKNECNKIGELNTLDNTCELKTVNYVPVSQYNDNKEEWRI